MSLILSVLVLVVFFVASPTTVLCQHSPSVSSPAVDAGGAAGLVSYTSDNYALVVEEAEPRALVANLSRIPAYGGRTASRVTLVEASSYFVIRQGMALVQTQRVDREALCGQSSSDVGVNVNAFGQCNFTLRLWVQFPDGTYERSVPFNVLIQDVNDNEPRWTQSADSSFVVDVPENAATFYKVALPAATDPDQGPNGALIYRLSPIATTGTGPNSEEPNSNSSPNSQAQSILTQTQVREPPPSAFALDMSDPQAPKLLVREPLDHERRPSYRLNLTACDQGNQPRCSWRPLTVLVTDENDHTPRFVNGSATVGSYEVWLEESPAAPRDVLTVRAVDDDGHGGQQQHAIRYWLTSAPSMSPNKVSQFVIESDGRLLSTEGLDFETAPLPDHTYRLIVWAADGSGKDARSASASIAVHVLDANDNAPTYKRLLLDNPDPNVPFEFRENTLGLVGAIGVEDRDSGRNSELTCRLRDHASQALFELRRGSELTPLSAGGRQQLYELHARRKLDAEGPNPVTAVVECEDNGSPRQQASDHAFSVLVLDENDNGPAFRQSTAEFTLAENNQVGDLVGSLDWYDADTSEAHRRGARVELLDEGEREHFEVRLNPTSSAVELRALVPFDRETRDLYDLHVRIFDPTLTTSSSTSSSSSATSNGDASQAESITGNAGSEIRVVVRIADVNDNIPVLVVKNLTVPEGPVSSGMLLRLNATDGDAPGTQNSRLSYGFLDAEGKPVVHGAVRSFNPNRMSGSGSSSSSSSKTASSGVGVGAGETSDGSVQFSMQPSGSGNIYLDTASLDRELEDTHCVRVFVRDNGDYPPGALSSSRLLCVFVMDVNDEAPSFIFPNDAHNSLNVTVAQFLSGHVNNIGRVQSVDRDTGPGGEVLYSIAENCGVECCCSEFAIDATSGMLHLRRRSHSSASPVPSQNTANQQLPSSPIRLIVKATDRGAVPQSTTTTLLVYLVATPLDNGRLGGIHGATSSAFGELSWEIVVLVLVACAALAALALILFVGYLVYCCYCRSKRRRMRKSEMVRRDAENAEAQRLSPQFLPQNSNGSSVYLNAHSPVTPISEDFSHLTPGDEMQSLLRGRSCNGGAGSTRSSGVGGSGVGNGSGSGIPPGLERQVSRVSTASGRRSRMGRSHEGRDPEGTGRGRDAELNPASLSSTSSASCIGTRSGNSNQIQMQTQVMLDQNSMQQTQQLLNNGDNAQQLPQVLVNGGSIGGSGSLAMAPFPAPLRQSTLRRQRAAAAASDRDAREHEPQSTTPDFSDSADSRISSGTGPSSTFRADSVAFVRPPRVVSPIKELSESRTRRANGLTSAQPRAEESLASVTNQSERSSLSNPPSSAISSPLTIQTVIHAADGKRSISRPLEQNLETESQKNFDRRAESLVIGIGKQCAVALSASTEDVTSGPSGESDHSGLSNGKKPGDGAVQNAAMVNGQHHQQNVRAASALPESFTFESDLHAATSSAAHKTFQKRDREKDRDRKSTHDTTRVIDADAHSAGRLSRSTRRAKSQLQAPDAHALDSSDESENDKPFWNRNLNLPLRAHPNGVHQQCPCSRCFTSIPKSSSSTDPNHDIYVPRALAEHYAQTGTSPITPLPTPSDINMQNLHYPQYMSALMQRSFSQPHEDPQLPHSHSMRPPVASTMLTSSLARPILSKPHALALPSLQPRPQSSLGRRAIGDQQLMLSVVSPLGGAGAGGAGGLPAGLPGASGVSPIGGLPAVGSLQAGPFQRTVKAPYTLSSYV